MVEIRCSRLEMVPNGTHWVILTEVSITTQSDARALATDGAHGYPGVTENYLEYRAFTSEKEWMDEIKRLARSSRKEDILALVVNPATIETKVEIHIAT